MPRKSSCLPKGPNPAFHDQERLGNDDYMRLHATVITSTCDKFLLLRRMLNKIKRKYKHPVCQKGISSVFREQFGRGIKLKKSENAEGDDVELKDFMCIRPICIS